MHTHLLQDLSSWVNLNCADWDYCWLQRVVEVGRCTVSKTEGMKQSKNSLGLGSWTLPWQCGFSPCPLEELNKTDREITLEEFCATWVKAPWCLCSWWQDPAPPVPSSPSSCLSVVQEAHAMLSSSLQPAGGRIDRQSQSAYRREVLAYWADLTKILWEQSL